MQEFGAWLEGEEVKILPNWNLKMDERAGYDMEYFVKILPNWNLKDLEYIGELKTAAVKILPNWNLKVYIRPVVCPVDRLKYYQTGI